jgi:hypothetical protein
MGSRLCLVGLAAAAGFAAQACAYVERRWNDLADSGAVSVGMGVEASARLGEALHLGLGSSLSTETAPLLFPVPALYQIMYGSTAIRTEHWLPWSLIIGQYHDVPAVAHSIKWSSVYPYGPTPTRATRAANPDLGRWVGELPQHRCFLFAPFHLNRDPIQTDPRHWADVEFSLFLIFGGKVSFRPVEFLDFLFGFIPGVDIMGDDEFVERVPLGPYWYKTPQRDAEVEPNPPQVPPSNRPPGDPPYVPTRQEQLGQPGQSPATWPPR